MIPLGTRAFGFSLPDVRTGTAYTLKDDLRFKATVIMFICNHCPYVKHINEALVKLAKDFQDKGVNFIAINANDVEHYPDDSPENMKKTAQALGYPFPYLYDESQEVARAYQAACTPDFYVFDQKLELVYRGQFDDSRPGNLLPVTGESIRSALECLLLDEPVDPNQKPSLGCNIKWRQN